MSALSALLIFTLVMLAVTALGIAGLFLFKNPKVHNGIFVFVALLSIWASFLGATSAPSNYIGTQLVGWFWGLLAIAALAVHFFLPKYAKYATYLLVFAAAASVIDLLLI